MAIFLCFMCGYLLLDLSQGQLSILRIGILQPGLANSNQVTGTFQRHEIHRADPADAKDDNSAKYFLNNQDFLIDSLGIGHSYEELKAVL